MHWLDVGLESANLRALGQVCELLWRWCPRRIWEGVGSLKLTSCWHPAPAEIQPRGCHISLRGRVRVFGSMIRLGNLEVYWVQLNRSLKVVNNDQIWKRAVHYIRITDHGTCSKIWSATFSRRKLNAFGGSKSPWFAGRLYGRSKIDIWGALTAKRSRRITWKCKTAIDCLFFQNQKPFPHSQCKTLLYFAAMFWLDPDLQRTILHQLM